VNRFKLYYFISNLFPCGTSLAKYSPYQFIATEWDISLTLPYCYL